MSSGSQSHPVQTRPGWHRFFAEAVRLALAPAILLLSGFFTMNFFLSGQYTWPKTSRVFALTLTALILSYEFVYKEQVVRRGVTDEQAWKSVLYACVAPYVIGVLLMVAIWTL